MAARLLRLWVRVPLAAWMSVCSERCVLSGRCLCDELITRPEESYRIWCVVMCDLETLWMRRPRPTGGCRAKNKHHMETKIQNLLSFYKTYWKIAKKKKKLHKIWLTFVLYYMQVIQPLAFYECRYLFTIHCHHYSRFLVVREVISKIQPPQFVFE